jgi:2-dehydropantoate 2-reductase
MKQSADTNPSLPRAKIMVVGMGAVGSFYGAKLAQGGARVTAVCRSDYEVLKNQGVQITSVWGDFRFHPEKVVRSAGEDLAEFPDIILVALKVLPEIDAAELIRAAVGPQTAILLLQNGVEIEAAIASAFPANEIISGLAFICVTRLAPGHIEHQDYGRLVIGRYPSGTSEKVELLAALFNRSGTPCQTTSDVVTARWQKLVWNAPFNPISVLSGGADTRTILECTEAARLVRRVMEEVCLLAQTTGHDLPPEVIEKNLADTLRMTPYKTSTLLDYQAGRPMEVEAILGNAVRVSSREGVPAPHLQTLYALLKLADQQNRQGNSR